MSSKKNQEKNFKDFVDPIDYLSRLMKERKIDWMIVSGMAVHLYNNPQRELTDIDLVVRSSDFYEIETYFRQNREIDGLSRVNFINKFGDVFPLTPYLRLFLKGVEVHLANSWVYRMNSHVVHIPFDQKAFSDAVVFEIDGCRIKVARPELIFLCKSIANRTYYKGETLVRKDLDDCQSLVNNSPRFDFGYLENLYRQLKLENLYAKVAEPMKLVHHESV